MVSASPLPSTTPAIAICSKSTAACGNVATRKTIRKALAKGQGVNAIARELGISSGTVRNVRDDGDD